MSLFLFFFLSKELFYWSSLFNYSCTHQQDITETYLCMSHYLLLKNMLQLVQIKKTENEGSVWAQRRANHFCNTHSAKESNPVRRVSVMDSNKRAIKWEWVKLISDHLNEYAWPKILLSLFFFFSYRHKLFHSLSR